MGNSSGGADLIEPTLTEPTLTESTFVGQALDIAFKDLQIEWHSKVTITRALPFAGILLVLFATALDPDRGLLPRLAPGLFWVAILLSALLAIGRSFAVERTNRAGVGLLLSGLDPAAMFLGKATAVAVELMALEALVGIGMVVIYGVDVPGIQLAILTAVTGAFGIAASGTLYGAFTAGDGSHESLLAVLLLPVLLPVVIGGTHLLESATSGPSSGDGMWLGLLGVFAVLYLTAGSLAFGSIIEEV